MKAIEMTNEQLVKHTKQVEKDCDRLFREREDKGVDTPLYEALQYLRFLCKERNLKI